MSLLTKTGIAGAVAREIHRADQFSHYSHSEGLAYKAEFDRAGSSALKLCEDFTRDCARMGRGFIVGKFANVVVSS